MPASAHSIADREQPLLAVSKRIRALSLGLNIEIELSGRIKSPTSLSAKMLKNGLPSEEILDIIGIRAVTDTTRDCYRLVRCIHSTFPVILGEYDDYIAAPKPNGYRSLHTNVLSPGGLVVEIQVRTHAMHEHSERGFAAHSKYKRHRGVLSTHKTASTAKYLQAGAYYA